MGWGNVSLVAALLASEATIKYEVVQNEVDKNKGFWVKFGYGVLLFFLHRDMSKTVNRETPFMKFDKFRAWVVFDTLAREFGPVAIDKFFFSEKKKELNVCFETLIRKKACLSSRVPGVGIPMVYINPNAFKSELYTIFIEMVTEKTTNDQIEKPFSDTEIKPKSIMLNYTLHFIKKEKILTQNHSRNKDKAFINFHTEENLHQALQLHRVKINRYHYNLVVGRNSNPDECKEIIGFWYKERISSLNLMYFALEFYLWNALYIQSTNYRKYLNKKEGHNQTENLRKNKKEKNSNIKENYLILEKAECSKTTTLSNLLLKRNSTKQCTSLSCKWEIKCYKSSPLSVTVPKVLSSPSKVPGKAKSIQKGTKSRNQSEPT
jgi:hypothetical protein